MKPDNVLFDASGDVVELAELDTVRPEAVTSDSSHFVSVDRPLKQVFCPMELIGVSQILKFAFFAFLDQDQYSSHKP